MSSSIQERSIPELSGNRWVHSSRTLLLAVLMAAPLEFGAVEPWAWAAMTVCTFVAVLLWCIGSFKSRQLNVRGTALYVCLLLFLMLMLIQQIGKITFDPLSARESIVKFVTYSVVFFLGRELFRRDRKKIWYSFGLIVTIYVFLMALFATIQFFSSPGLLYWVRKPLWGGVVFGPYVNHNHYAGLMEILIPIALGYLVATDKETARPALVFAVLFAVASVLLSGSRGGMISLILQLVVFEILLLRPNRHAMRSRTLITAGFGFIAAVLLLFLWLDPGEVTKRLEQTASSPQMGLADRKLYASDAIRMFKKHPLLGIGVGSFEAAYPAYQTFSSDLVVNHAHDDYVEALAEAGIIGSLLIVSAIVLFLRAVSSIHPTGNSVDWIAVGAAVGCCGLLIHSFSDFNLHIPANAAWFAFTAGIATASGKHHAKLHWKRELEIAHLEPTRTRQESCI